MLFFPKASPKQGSRLGFGVQGVGRVAERYLVAGRWVNGSLFVPPQLEPIDFDAQASVSRALGLWSSVLCSVRLGLSKSRGFAADVLRSGHRTSRSRSRDNGRRVPVSRRFQERPVDFDAPLGPNGSLQNGLFRLLAWVGVLGGVGGKETIPTCDNAADVCRYSGPVVLGWGLGSSGEAHLGRPIDPAGPS